MHVVWMLQQRGSGGEGPFSPERDRAESGAPRLKGVQFPFSVNDRVLIKVRPPLQCQVCGVVWGWRGV